MTRRVKQGLTAKPAKKEKKLPSSVQPNTGAIEEIRAKEIEAMPAPPEYPPLPEIGGPARAVLMLVHPRQMFLYWVLDAEKRRDVERLGGSAELKLEISDGVEGYREVFSESFDFRTAGWYLKNGFVDCMARVRVGFSRGGKFTEILISNPVRVPREYAGEDPEIWMDLEALRKKPLPSAELDPAKAGKTPPKISTGRYMFGGATGRNPKDFKKPRKERPDYSRIPGVQGYLSFVLHTHLPFIRHPERDYFLEEQWLFEAITETYLPIIAMLERLHAEGFPIRITMSMSPTLLAMLRDPVLVGKYERHLDRMCELAGREVERTRGDAVFSPITAFYQERLTDFRTRFVSKYNRDLVSAFAALEDVGVLELITVAATHGFLPLLSVQKETVWAQVATAVEQHEKHLGHAPEGIWLPECAYFEGLDEMLAKAGLKYFFVDAHAVKYASSEPRFGTQAPIFCPTGVAAFCRDEECSVQVWSSELGYPGDPAYRDFYRDIGFDLDASYVGPYTDPSGIRGMTGFKYHRVTGRSNHKEPYRRDWAMGAKESHAEDFAINRSRQFAYLTTKMDRPPLVVAMFDAELFGHWWFEGPDWIEAVLRRLPERQILPISPAQYLKLFPVGQVAEPAGSSWGEKGYFEVWLNSNNDWMYPALHDAGRRMVELANRFSSPTPMEERMLKQLSRELLLAQASDWPFILRTGTSVGYARRRIHEHLNRFDRLARQLEEGRHDEPFLSGIEHLDNIFPDVDPLNWRTP